MDLPNTEHSQTSPTEENLSSSSTNTEKPKGDI